MTLRSPRVRLWRWRRNPLKRRADRVEAWLLLGSWVLSAFLGLLAGLAAGGAVERELARERAEFQRTPARLTASAPGTAPGRAVASADRVWARVRWTGPDGRPRTGQVRVDPGSPAGTPVQVWTDRAGRLVTPPTTPADAALRAGLIGTVAGLGAAFVPLAAGRVLCARVERRSIERWGEEWARFGPMWRRTV